MTIRLFSAIAISACLGAGVSARDLTVAGRGGALQAAQAQAVFEPFTEVSGITIRLEAWDGKLGTIQREIGMDASTWDLVQIGPDVLQTGCDDGLFEKMDWPALGGKDHYLPQGVSECGVGAVLYNVVLGWDREKFQGTPGWGDFWDVAKYPGKRGLHRGARMNLEIALMADGVAPGDVYRTLRSEDGVDRAFRKLDQIKPYVAWWRSQEEASKMLETGDVLLVAIPNIAVADLSRLEGRRFGTQWAGSLSMVDFWVIVRATPKLAEAMKLLTALGDPAAEARMTAIIPYGGLARGSSAGLAPEQLAQSPSNPANIATSLQIDDQFWRENQVKLNQRFEAWLAL